MFLRVYHPKEEKELLINLDMIWKIEVFYVAPREGELPIKISLRAAKDMPEAFRVYRIFVGSEEVLLPANPDDPGMKAIERIYNEALKG